MKNCSLILLLAFFANSLAAQTRNIAHQNIAWLGYMNNLQISHRWSLSSETQVRYFFDNGNRNLWAVRFRLYRKLGKNWETATGIARFVNLRNTPEALALAVPELRPMLEFGQRQTLSPRWLLHHRYMAEGRFFRNTTNGALADGYKFNWRFRYRFGADFDIIKAQKPSNSLKFRVFDEILVNAGTNVGRNFFDQNRLFLALQIPLAEHFQLEIGHFQIFQQRSSGDDFYERSTWRATLLHRIIVPARTD